MLLRQRRGHSKLGIALLILLILSLPILAGAGEHWGEQIQVQVQPLAQQTGP